MPFFFSDPNHEDRTHIDDMAKRLPDLVKRSAINTLFVEFLYVDTNKLDLREEFATCAGGRRYMTQPYLAMVKTAKDLGLRVVGLTMPLYTTDMRRQAGAGFAFRAGGGFDVVASEIIYQNAKDYHFGVFLGAGHYRHLSKHIPGLELVGAEDRDPEPTLTALDVKKAEEWTETLLDELMWNAVKLVLSKKKLLVRTTTGKEIEVEVDGSDAQLQVVTFGEQLALEFPSSKDKLRTDWKRSKYPPMPDHRFDAIWKNFYQRTGSGKVLKLGS